MRLFIAIAGLVALALLVRAASGAPAPTLSVRALGPAAPPAKPIADGHFQMMPAGCSGAACTGFKIGNPADLKSRTNSAAFKVGASKVALDASKARTLVEVGTVELTNGGFMQPTGAGMPLIPMRAELQLTSQGADGKAATTPVPIDFTVMWTLGSPAPANTAGIFALVMHHPVPAANFTLPAVTKGGKAAAMTAKLVGFTAAGGTSGLQLLGDWGQPDPKAGEPGARVAVKQGAGPQVLKLVAAISKAA